MISNLRISVAELVVWALLAAAGLTWLLLGIGRGLERAWEWWRFRRDYAEGDEELIESLREALAPERTWEQMTSHQLPLTEIAERNPRWVAAGRPMLTAAQERRPPAYEIEHRAHYVAMGLDYPSGLMERVRELAP